VKSDANAVHNPNMASGGWRVVIDERDGLRALCKVRTLSDGGYSVITPYHNSREVWLFRFQIDYRQAKDLLPISEMDHFCASDRVKLSHHFDGFVQVSSENRQTIRSGRDRQTGEPKGLAIMSAPIERPIKTGPTFGATAWGLGDFEQVTNPRETDVIFHSKDIYYRGCTPRTFNSYRLEGFIFDPNMWAGVRGPENDLRLSMGFRYFEGSGANLEFRVLPLLKTECFIGICISRSHVDFPSASGYQLSFPSDRRAGADVAQTLMACYPRFGGMGVDAEPLDYVPGNAEPTSHRE
jgi:hypothetical protein